MSNDFKIAIIQQMSDIRFCAGKEIFYADDVIASRNKCSHKNEPRKPLPPVTKIRLFARIGPSSNTFYKKVNAIIQVRIHIG